MVGPSLLFGLSQLPDYAKIEAPRLTSGRLPKTGLYRAYCLVYLRSKAVSTDLVKFGLEIVATPFTL